jgi:hypothetical protein
VVVFVRLRPRARPADLNDFGLIHFYQPQRQRQRTTSSHRGTTDRDGAESVSDWVRLKSRQPIRLLVLLGASQSIWLTNDDSHFV